MAPAGTQETICRIVEEYSDMLLRLACTRLDSTQDAEDAVQEVFLSLLSSKPVFRDAGHEKAWPTRRPPRTLLRAPDLTPCLALPRKPPTRGPLHCRSGPLSLSKNLCLDESARVLAGELEGAAARLEWDQMP